jgi:hypothetical protein
MNNMKKWNTLIKQIKRFASTGSDNVKAIKLDKIIPSLQIAAEVSSQEDSMASIVIFSIFFIL